MVWSKTDEKLMRRCLSLSLKGEGKVSPNPIVGSVIAKGGKIISEGYHSKFGGPHAEAIALAKAGAKARGATLYVSLEPCSHKGIGKKTPPCAPAIAKAGIARVVIATEDKNPLVSGKGIEMLRSAGIAVDVGLLREEAQVQNEAFFKFIKTGKPFVVAKVAQTNRGIMGIRGKGKVWLSGKEFDYYCHALRNRYDAILVGIGTVISDNPRLTCRIKGGRNLARIIMDGGLRIPLNAKVLQRAHSEKVIIASSQQHDAKKRLALEKLGVQVVVCGNKKAGLARLIALLPALGIHSLLIEGGAAIHAHALKRKLVDKAIICISKKSIRAKKGDEVLSPYGKGAISKLKRKKTVKMGVDKVVEGYFR